MWKIILFPYNIFSFLQNELGLTGSLVGTRVTDLCTGTSAESGRVESSVTHREICGGRESVSDSEGLSERGSVSQADDNKSSSTDFGSVSIMTNKSFTTSSFVVPVCI